jgi:hypothetical protein
LFGENQKSKSIPFFHKRQKKDFLDFNSISCLSFPLFICVSIRSTPSAEWHIRPTFADAKKHTAQIFVKKKVFALQESGFFENKKYEFAFFHF